MAKTSYAIALGLEPAQPPRLARPRRCARRWPSCGPSRSRAIRATPALGPAGRGFANAVAIVESKLEPDELLAELKAMERAFGRRPGRRWGPRVLDLDIILWSDGAWGGPGPIVPHPEYPQPRLRPAAARRAGARTGATR